MIAEQKELSGFSKRSVSEGLTSEQRIKIAWKRIKGRLREEKQEPYFIGDLRQGETINEYWLRMRSRGLDNSPQKQQQLPLELG